MGDNMSLENLKPGDIIEVRSKDVDWKLATFCGFVGEGVMACKHYTSRDVMLFNKENWRKCVEESQKFYLGARVRNVSIPENTTLYLIINYQNKLAILNELTKVVVRITDFNSSSYITSNDFSNWFSFGEYVKIS
jgi:hypothetical protein